MLILDSRARFSVTADLYRYRPSYPAALIDWIVTNAGLYSGAKIADVGCGTGIASRLFADRGYDVVGIDPNPEMLEQAGAIGGRPRYLRGESTATGLDDGSMDLIVCAQSFHWFDTVATLSELRRVLSPGGHCVAFWNVRSGSPLMDEYEQLLSSIGDYRAVPKPADAIRAIERSPQVTELRGAEFPFSQRLDRQGFFGRVGSSSYVAHSRSRRAEFERELDRLFVRYAEGGEVEFTYRTVARMWQPRGRN